MTERLKHDELAKRILSDPMAAHEFISYYLPEPILLDKKKGYIYIRNFLWYSDSELPEDKQPVLNKIITKHLPREDREDIMRTIAQKYREEGKQEAIRTLAQKYREEGQEKGIQMGEEKSKLEIAKALLKEG